MILTDSQHALLAERLADYMVANLDTASMERMIYDTYLDEFLLMDTSDLLFEAETHGVEVPDVISV